MARDRDENLADTVDELEDRVRDESDDSSAAAANGATSDKSDPDRDKKVDPDSAESSGAPEPTD